MFDILIVLINIALCSYVGYRTGSMGFLLTVSKDQLIHTSIYQTIFIQIKKKREINVFLTILMVSSLWFIIGRLIGDPILSSIGGVYWIISLMVERRVSLAVKTNMGI